MVATRDLFNDPRPQPRDYQLASKRAILSTLADRGLCLAELATGLGKTLLAAMVSEHYRRVLICDPRITLCAQIAGGVEAYRLRDVEIEQADKWARADAPLVVASLQSLLTAGRGERFSPDLVIVDEAHYATTGEALNLFDRYRSKGAHVLGLTATPHARPDGTSILHYFGECPVQYGVVPGIQHGWLVPISARRVVVKSLDYGKARRSAGLDPKEVEKALRQEAVYQEQAALVAGNHRTHGAVYTSSIKGAEALRELLQDRHGIPTSLVHSKMPPSQRAEELSRYESGGSKLIVNVAVLTMGWDAPCEELHLLAPTCSLPLYHQIVGRGLRPLRGSVDGQPTEYLRRLAIKHSSKPHCRVIDYCDNVRYHRLCSAIDLVLPPQKAQKYREKLLKQSEEEEVELADIDAAVLEQDKLERERERAEAEAEKARRRQLVVGVTFDAHSADPFAKPTAATPKRREARMLWGPYRGQPVRLIPRQELKRILRTMRRSPGSEWLVKAITRELGKVNETA
jgi:superfamily II DNA or RNA helicase